MQILAGLVDVAAAAATLYVLLPRRIRQQHSGVCTCLRCRGCAWHHQSCARRNWCIRSNDRSGAWPWAKSGCNRGTCRLSRHLHAHTISCGDCRFRRIGSPSQASYSRWPDNSGCPDIRAVDSAAVGRHRIPRRHRSLDFGSHPGSASPRLSCSPTFCQCHSWKCRILAQASSGVALLIVARGLARRLWRAWLVALVLFSLGAIFALAKGLAWEEALMLTLMAATLISFPRFVLPQADGRAFHPDLGLAREHRYDGFRNSLAWLLCLSSCRVCKRTLVAIRVGRAGIAVSSRLGSGSDASCRFDDQHCDQRGWSR